MREINIRPRLQQLCMHSRPVYSGPRKLESNSSTHTMTGGNDSVSRGEKEECITALSRVCLLYFHVYHITPATIETVNYDLIAERKIMSKS